MINKIHEFVGTKIRPIELATLIKNVLGIKRSYYEVNGDQLFLDPVSNFGLRILRDGYYEPEMTELILRHLDDGDEFIDLGGNEGYFSILASKKVGRKGKVYCIEPQSRLWAVIAKNINKNHCYNVSVMPFAISDRISEVSISLTPSLNTGSSSIVQESRKKFWKVEKLESATLDDLFFQEGKSRIKLMKVDIEGFEYFALMGSCKILENKVIKNIIIEFHPGQLKQLGQSIEDIHSFLSNYGYKYADGVFTCS